MGWVRQLTGAGQNEAKRLIQQGKVHVNGRMELSPFQIIASGIDITVDTDRRRPRRQVEFGRGNILFLDEVLIIVEKPSGLVSVPPTPTGEPTLLDHLNDLLESGTPQAKAVHRLDRGTSGLMVFGREGPALSALAGQFRGHQVDRRYLAVVAGNMQDQQLEGSIDVSRTRFSSRRQEQLAATRFRRVRAGNGRTLMECRPETGRFHQLRIQLAMAGHPIVGDREHGTQESPATSKRLALHSAYLRLRHPSSGLWMEFESPLPEDLGRLLEG
jgi:RluA family pseudouridine synthase